VVPGNGRSCRCPTATETRSRSTSSRASSRPDRPGQPCSRPEPRHGQPRHVGQPAAAAHWTRPIAGKTVPPKRTSPGVRRLTDGYAASSIVFADGSKPAKICFASPPHLTAPAAAAARNGSWPGRGADVLHAFTRSCQHPDHPDPGPDPAYMTPAAAAPRCPTSSRDRRQRHQRPESRGTRSPCPVQLGNAAGTVIRPTPRAPGPAARRSRCT